MKICPNSVLDHSSNYAQAVRSTMLVSIQGDSEELETNVMGIMKYDVITVAVERDTLIVSLVQERKKHNDPL